MSLLHFPNNHCRYHAIVCTFFYMRVTAISAKCICIGQTPSGCAMQQPIQNGLPYINHPPVMLARSTA
jgi:hypothetical protein